MKISTLRPFRPGALPGIIQKTAVLAALGFATALPAQTIVTNYINFSDFAGTQGTALAAQPVNGMPGSITASWGWQFILVDDFTNWGAAYQPPSGSVEAIDCRAGSVVTFSSPVVVWSLEAYRAHWGPTQRIVGKLNGSTVWLFNQPGADDTWQTVTSGAFQPVDSIEFDCEDWNTRYTDIYISDAAGVPPPPQAPLLTFFASSPPSPQFLAPGSPVQLSWLVRPGATVTIDQGVGDVSGQTDGTGNGSFPSVNPTTNTTYTLTAKDGTNVATATVTLNVNLPTGVGLLTFEDLPTQETALPANYRWNLPAGLNVTWTGWNQKGGTLGGTPTTPMIVYPTGNATLDDGSNIASIQFTAADGTTPKPVMLNSFSFMNDPRMPGWGAGQLYIEGRLAGVAKWSMTTNDLVDWYNLVTKGAGIWIDELVVQAKWYQYDNFAITTQDAPASPIQISPALQNGQVQFTWNTGGWPGFLLYTQHDLTNGWAAAAPTLLTTNSFSLTPADQGFYRLMRFP